jgi:O-antigen/teichoic acid export membrane protein
MESDESADYSELESALSSIGLSAAILLGATLVSQGLGLLTRITMARYLPVDGYGNVVIGLSILNLGGLLALVGMPAALSRYIPRKETDDERRAIVISGFQIVSVLSVILAIAVFLIAKPMAIIVFGNQNIVWVIRIFAGILPFYAILKLSLGGFRGYETTYPRVLTQNVLRPGLQLAGIVLFVSLGYDTVGIAFAYASGFGVVALVSLSLLYRVSKFSLRDLTRQSSVTQYRELLAFSIPLATSGAINVIAKHSDLIILGIFKSSTQVGVYEVTFRIGIFVALLISPTIGYLFQPIMSRFDANAEQSKMDNLYTVATRWVVVASFPVFSLFFLFPEQSLTFFFGESYQAGQDALRILLIGFLLAIVPGLTGNFLTALGQSKLLMYISAATMFLNIGVNILLIPTYGIVGAAIATATARTFNNTAQMYFIHKYHNIHPFKRNYILPTVLIGTVFIFIYFSPIPLSEFTFIEGFGVAAGLGLLYICLLLVTRSLYLVELKLIDALLIRIGIPMSISTYFQRFTQ